MQVHSKAECSHSTLESALEICNRKVRIALRGEGGKRSGCGTSRRSKFQRAVKNGTYVTKSTKTPPYIYVQLLRTLKLGDKRECANPDKLLRWELRGCSQPAHKGHKKYRYKGSIW